MSDWLTLTNKIKSRPLEFWMTVTQRKVLTQLEYWLYHPDIVNLYGGVGVGKTFLAWALAHNLPAKHVIVPERLTPSYDPILNMVVDNAPHTEQAVRNILKQCNLCGSKRVVLISGSPVVLPMHRIELPPPTLDELRYVEHNLVKFNFQEHPVAEGANFWQVINCFV